MVYNEVTYPHLVFEELGVETMATDMSFVRAHEKL